jgi:SAM-dependent methyltransferase
MFICAEHCRNARLLHGDAAMWWSELMRNYLVGLFEEAMAHNKRNILALVNPCEVETLLDLGCDDGIWTLEVAKACRAKNVAGLEIVEERAVLAREKGIAVKIADLGNRLPYEDESFDLIHANQVIEHVCDVDHFAQELRRLLKPGGTAVISTENASSWHNIFALLFGWQIFSLTNMSSLRSGIGNPLALARHESPTYKSWTHKVIFSYRELREFFGTHRFTDLEIAGAGYYPLPTAVAALDPRHAHFITIRVSKPTLF